MIEKQLSEKLVVTDKLSAVKIAAKNHLPEEVPADGAVGFEQVASDTSVSEQPLLMAKADIDLVATGEPASGGIASDADVAYTDHITVDVAETVSDQPELLAMNTVQHLTDSTVLVGEEVAVGAAAASSGGFPWMLAGAGLAAGVGTGFAVGSSNNHDAAPPAPPADPTVHIVVERDGAYFDTDGDGVLDTGECTHAVFGGASDNVGLADHQVVVHFNDVPLDAINLNGFGTDDKIEFDIASFQSHDLLSAGADHLSFYSNAFASTGARNYPHTVWLDVGGASLALMTGTQRHGYLDSMTDFNHNAHGTAIHGIGFTGLYTSVNSTTSGVIAYWSDANNALNHQSLLFPDHAAGTKAVAANINAGNYAGLIDFVWPDQTHVDVIVNSCGAFVDLNGNGVIDYACCGPNEWACHADFSSGGSADLANHAVTIHFDDVPYQAIDITGFTTNDKIEVDVASFHDNGKAAANATHFTSFEQNVANGHLEYVYLSLPGTSSYTVFFQGQGRNVNASSHASAGALAFYTDGINGERDLAFWTDSSNPLGNVKNIMPGVTTTATSGMVSGGSSAALSALNQGVGHGVLVDFIWPPPVV